jgi:tocopherol cyclase
MLKKLRNPDVYHGQRKTRDFFEGWYFKIVDPTEQHVFAFIPGIFRGKRPEESHSFIQCVHGGEASYHYQPFPVEDFRADSSIFRLAVGKNKFSLENIALALREPALNVQGSIAFKKVLKWPDTLLNPGSMGFYNYIPNMQCYSQVCAMDMDLEGALTVNGREISFTGGRGYIEKNWGRAFPYSWIWIQANNFSKARSSLSCSLGHIPFLFTSFRGFLVGLFVEGKFYLFSTINGTKARVVQKGGDVEVLLRNAHHTLTLQTQTQAEKFILLKGPRDGQMVPLVQENLQGRVKVVLQETGGKELYADEGSSAGIEYGGEQMMVLDV